MIRVGVRRGGEGDEEREEGEGEGEGERFREREMGDGVIERCERARGGGR